MDENHRITFEKPDIPALRENHTVVDMHFHTKYSDGFNSVDAIARHARKLGVGIAITDHNEIQGAVEINAYPGILSIPGIEITSVEGTHILVYFYDIKSLKRFYRDQVVPFMGSGVMSSTSLHMESIVERSRRYRTLIIFPHPYCAAYTGIQNSYFDDQRRKRLFDHTHGVEVINGTNLKKWNYKSALLGFNLNRAITGGSDGHALRHMGRVVSYADCRKTRSAFLDAVKAGHSKVIGKEIDIIRKVGTNGRKLKSTIRNYPDMMEKNIKYSYNFLNLKSRNLKENVKKSLNGKISRRKR